MSESRSACSCCGAQCDMVQEYNRMKRVNETLIQELLRFREKVQVGIAQIMEQAGESSSVSNLKVMYERTGSPKGESGSVCVQGNQDQPSSPILGVKSASFPGNVQGRQRAIKNDKERNGDKGCDSTNIDMLEVSLAHGEKNHPVTQCQKLYNYSSNPHVSDVDSDETYFEEEEEPLYRERLTPQSAQKCILALNGFKNFNCATPEKVPQEEKKNLCCKALFLPTWSLTSPDKFCSPDKSQLMNEEIPGSLETLQPINNLHELSHEFSGNFLATSTQVQHVEPLHSAQQAFEGKLSYPNKSSMPKKALREAKQSSQRKETPLQLQVNRGLKGPSIPKPVQERLNSSFDRPPQWQTSVPSKYRYKHSPVRKRAARKKLKGWTCTQCCELYDAFGDDRDALVQKVSRHRSHHGPRAKTPPGFWDPGMPSTQELEEFAKQ